MKTKIIPLLMFFFCSIPFFSCTEEEDTKYIPDFQNTVWRQDLDYISEQRSYWLEYIFTNQYALHVGVCKESNNICKIFNKYKYKYNSMQSSIEFYDVDTDTLITGKQLRFRHGVLEAGPTFYYLYK